MTYICKVGLACDLCGECVDTCTAGALTITDKLVFNNELCTFCETCVDICPEYAIRIYFEE